MALLLAISLSQKNDLLLSYDQNKIVRITFATTVHSTQNDLCDL